MPKVKADHITMNLEQQETGEPQILIPYLAADYACCASRWPSTPSISPVPQSTCAGRGKPTNRNASIHRAFRRRCRRIHASCGDPEGAHLRPAARRGQWHVAGGQVS